MLPQTFSASLLRQLPEERKIVKLTKNEELLMTPQSNRSRLNEVVETLEMQWQNIRRQHLENRSTSKSPAKNNLASQLRQKEKILKKVVPLSTINLVESAQKQNFNPLKESSHFQYIANKYSNIYRRPSPDQSAPRIVNNQYQRNNLKVIDERVRTNSRDRYVLQMSNNMLICNQNSASNINSTSQVRQNPRKRVSQYQRNESLSENRSQRQLQQVPQQGLPNNRLQPKRRN